MPKRGAGLWNLTVGPRSVMVLIEALDDELSLAVIGVELDTSLDRALTTNNESSEEC
jgi:hypothetical protein